MSIGASPVGKRATNDNRRAKNARPDPSDVGSWSADRRRQPLVEIGVELRQHVRVDAEKAEMSGDAPERPKLASRDQALLGLAVGRREEHIVTNRRDEGFGLDPSERRRKVAAGEALTSPRCHFHAIASRLLGSTGAK